MSLRHPLPYFALSPKWSKKELNILGCFGVYNTSFLRRGKKLLNLHLHCYKWNHISIELILATFYIAVLIKNFENKVTNLMR